MKSKILLLSFCLSFIIASDLFAQHFEMQMTADDTSALELRFLKPVFENGDGISFSTGTYDIRLKYWLGDRLNLIANVNYNAFSNELFGSANGLGNVFLGLQMKNQRFSEAQKGFLVGVFLPTRGNDIGVGGQANFYDLSKYFEDAVTLSSTYQYFRQLDNGLRIAYEMGPDIVIFTDSGGRDDIEITGHYAFSLGYEKSKVFLLAELLGTAILTESGSFDARTTHSISGGVGYNGPKFIPRVFYKKYFDEIFGISGVFGVHIGFKLN